MARTSRRAGVGGGISPGRRIPRSRGWSSGTRRRWLQLANRLLGWPGDVDDVVQDVFLAAYRNRKAFRGQCLVRTWLFTITVNRCRSLQRRQRLHLRALSRIAAQPPKSTGRAGQGDEEFLGKVRQALDRLPGRYREPAVLWYLQEWSTDQICQVLGISRNTLYVRLARAREQLGTFWRVLRTRHE